MAGRLYVSPNYMTDAMDSLVTKSLSLSGNESLIFSSDGYTVSPASALRLKIPTNKHCDNSAAWLDDDVVNTVICQVIAGDRKLLSRLKRADIPEHAARKAQREQAISHIEGLVAYTSLQVSMLVGTREHPPEKKYVVTNVARRLMRLDCARFAQRAVKKVLFPSHVSGNHWVLFWVDIGNAEVMFYDPMGGTLFSNKEYHAVAWNIARYMAAFEKMWEAARDVVEQSIYPPFTFNDSSNPPQLRDDSCASLPRQTNSWDCGVLIWDQCARQFAPWRMRGGANSSSSRNTYLRVKGAVTRIT